MVSICTQAANVRYANFSLGLDIDWEYPAGLSPSTTFALVYETYI